MNLKNLIKLSTLLVLMITMLSGASFAQQTYWVDGVNGLDGLDGLHQTVTGVPGQGPKKTITNAITAASSGDIINVIASAPYPEALNITDKHLTLNSESGTAEVTGLLTIDIDVAVITTNDNVTFGGPFKFSGGITLVDGSIVGGGNVTVAGTFTRTLGTSVDAQLLYSGVVNFVYTGAGEMTTGPELPASSNTTALGNLTTAAGATLKLNESKTVNGDITLVGAVNLNGFTLNLTKTSGTYTLGGNVTNGTINFITSDGTANTQTLTGGAFNIPNVTVTGGHATANQVAIATTGTMGNLDVSGVHQRVTIAGPTTMGNVSNSSTGDATYGTVVLTSPTTVGNVTNSGTGAVTVAAATTIGSISNSADQVLDAVGAHAGITGLIGINTVAAVTVGGDVTLSSTGQIIFSGAGGATINGNVANNLNQTFTVTTSSNTVTYTSLGLISFSGGVVTINGTLTNNASMNATLTTDAGASVANFVSNGNILFAAAPVISGKITNNATAPSIAASGAGTETYTLCGLINFANIATVPAVENNTNFASAATNSGNINVTSAGAVTVQSLKNTSTSPTASNGMIDLSAVAGAVVVNQGVEVSGAAKGGDIIFPNQNVTVGGSVIDSKGDTGADIIIGSAGTTGIVISVSGDVVNSGKSNITVNSALDATFTVVGKIENSGTGTISFPNVTTGTFSLGSMALSNGTLSFAGAGAATGAINVKNINLAAGALALGTGVRTMTVTGPANFLGAATTTPTITGDNTTMVLAAPTPTTIQSFTIGNAGATYPGPFQVNNLTGLVDAVVISGGNLRVLNNVSFIAGQVVLNGANQRLFIGDEVNTKTGNFVNAAGYRTENNAFISSNSSAANTVTGAGYFGNFEVDNTNGTTINVTGDFKSIFNLTKGVVTVTSVKFNNTNPFPTIVRNAGTFNVAPTFTSMVNVYYIGIDKSTANELPVATNKLNDLTVATTNGATPAKGTVNVAVATTVNGTLTVNAGQALLINGVDVTMKGSSIILNGDIANVAAADELVLANPTGTIITGSGLLPDIQVAAASVGNKIVGSGGLITTLLGANNVRGTDDFAPATTDATGSIVFAGASASLDVAFGTAYAQKVVASTAYPTHLANISEGASSDTVKITANLYQGGNLTSTAGVVNVADAVVWTYRGLTPAIDGTNSKITGAGKLLFYQYNTPVTPTLTVNTAAGSIDVANVEIDLAADADAFVIQTNPITFSGNVTVTQGVFTMNSNVTLTGSAFTLTAHASVAGASILRMNPTVPPLTFSYTGSPSITNLTVSNDVVLGGEGTGLAVTGIFLHDGGDLNFADRTLTSSGVFTHTAGTYSATTGYLIFSGTNFNNNGAFTIPNLEYAAGAVAVGGDFVFEVTKNFLLNGTGAFTIDKNTAATGPTLTLSDGCTFEYTQGTLDQTPTYAGSINFNMTNTGSLTLPTNLWPATPTTLVNTLAVNNTANINLLAAARTVNVALTNNGIVTIPASGSITLVDGAPLYNNGTLAINSGTTNGLLTVGVGSDITLRSGAIGGAGNLVIGNDDNIIVVAGTLTVTNVTYGTNLDVTYAVNGAYGSGKELPGTVTNLTFTRTGNVINYTTTISTPVIVTGTLTIRNDVTTNQPINAQGDVVVALDAAYSNATLPVTTFNAPLTFSGSVDQLLSVPASGVTFGAITLNKALNTNKITLVGGNLNTGGITFINGVLVSGNNIVTIPAPFFGGGQGFSRTGVTGTNISHIVGNVAKTLVNFGTLATATEPRNEFPVGSLTLYRPVAITFNAVSGIPTIPGGITIIVNHADSSATGTVGLPIANGVAPGVAVARYPGFFWNIVTMPTSVSPSTVFDLELGARGFSGFDDINNVRIIRRNGTYVDITNQWLLQGGTGSFYDNNVIGGVPSIVVRSSLSGLIAGGAMFTLGLKTSLVLANPVADQTLTVGGAAFTKDLSNPPMITGNTGNLVYTAQSSNAAVATVAVAGNVITVTPVAQGSADISIKGTDDANNDFLTDAFSVTVAPITQFTVSGKVSYDNSESTPLTGVVVSVAGKTATTDSTGNYSIADVPNGTYTITASSAAEWAGANATDALSVANNFAGIITLAGLRLDAADVNNSGTANNTDALLILRKFADPTVVFAKGNWVFSSANITVAGAAVVQDLKGLAVGDVNGSDVPALAKASTTQLAVDGYLKVNPKEVFEVPVKVGADMKVSAMSLRFNFASDLVTFEGVAKQLDNLVINKENGSIAWADFSGKGALDLKAGQTLVTLKFRPTANFKAGSKLDVTLDGASELAGSEGNVINATLKAAAVEAFVPTEFALRQNYPNPFNPTTTIQYELPIDSKVTVVIFNSLGEQVSTLVNQMQSAGVYKVNFNAENLTSGVYFFRLHVEGERNFTQTQKMILMK
jgi:fibronectin-binding autotransporter adhesin